MAHRFAVWFIVNDDKVEHLLFETESLQAAENMARIQKQNGATSAYVIDNDTGRNVFNA